jgi:hypothetical protein
MLRLSKPLRSWDCVLKRETVERGKYVGGVEIRVCDVVDGQILGEKGRYRNKWT